MKKKIVITVTPEDAANAEAYQENHNCLLATAIKRQLGVFPNVGGTNVLLPSGLYKINTRGRSYIRSAYGNFEFHRPSVNKPFHVILTLW